jgi:hypothetical protein
VSCDPLIKLSNLYVYTKNNPFSYWDPSGQDDDELVSGVFNYYDTHPASSNLQAPTSPGSVAPIPWTSPLQSDETNGTNLSEGIQAYLQSQQNQLELEKKNGAIEQGSPRTYEEEVTAPVTHAASFAWNYPRLAPGIWRTLREDALIQTASLVLGASEGLITTGAETVLTEEGSATLAEATFESKLLVHPSDLPSVPGKVAASPGLGESVSVSGYSPPWESGTNTAGQVLQYSVDVGLPIRAAGGLDRGRPGIFFASHAERKALLESNVASASLGPCMDCRSWVQALAAERSEIIRLHAATYDKYGGPPSTWVFTPNNGTWIAPLEATHFDLGLAGITR